MQYPPDHALPLVQLKERRREMVVALQNRVGRVGDDELRQLATIQQAIAAIEDVIADLDCEVDETFSAAADRQVHSLPVFGGRTLVHSPV
ncbi:hypothetical protein [Bradyrhizobium sp. CCBAU 11434]|uniref:hypothetical protein n=1 Tax=Bradyrhizobium sp. CCBAU 11434 TaxID=1630885 RepID=UPI00230553C0|nr:hypothetical protein [Bradyrhizobium sp. CCBAU 11434]